MAVAASPDLIPSQHTRAGTFFTCSFPVLLPPSPALFFLHWITTLSAYLMVWRFRALVSRIAGFFYGRFALSLSALAFPSTAGARIPHAGFRHARSATLATLTGTQQRVRASSVCARVAAVISGGTRLFAGEQVRRCLGEGWATGFGSGRDGLRIALFSLLPATDMPLYSSRTALLRVIPHYYRYPAIPLTFIHACRASPYLSTATGLQGATLSCSTTYRAHSCSAAPLTRTVP